MELYKELLIRILTQQTVEISFSNMKVDIQSLIETECYRTLEKIKAVIHDDSLDDVECFMKIEQIICALEDSGSSGGMRHDFG